MARLVSVSAAFAVVALLTAAPALAAQCPKLINQINASAGNRFDAAAAEARAKAAESEQLHKAAKHADSVKAAQEGLAKLGVK